MTSKKSNVEVAIRVRPMNPEKGEEEVAWELHSNQLIEAQNTDNM